MKNFIFCPLRCKSLQVAVQDVNHRHRMTLPVNVVASLVADGPFPTLLNVCTVILYFVLDSNTKTMVVNVV